MTSDPGRCVAYELVRSKKRRKTLTLQVRRDGSVVLLAPHRVSDEEADRFFREKEAWVRKKLAERPAPDVPEEKTFFPGDTFLFRGETYPLEIVESDRGAALRLSHGVFRLRADRQGEARKVFEEWYKARAREEFTERLNHYAGRFGLTPTGLTISGAKTRYGSCSAANRISLSWRLVMAPYPVMDYVILHELAHIKVKNHSRRFWNFLESILPGCQQQRRWLKEKGHTLKL